MEVWNYLLNQNMAAFDLKQNMKNGGGGGDGGERQRCVWNELFHEVSV